MGWESKTARSIKAKEQYLAMKYWEIIADNLKKRGWSYGYVSAVDSSGANNLRC